MERVEETVPGIRQALNDQGQFMKQQDDWFGQQVAYQFAYLEYIGQMSRI